MLPLFAFVRPDLTKKKIHECIKLVKKMSKFKKNGRKWYFFWSFLDLSFFHKVEVIITVQLAIMNFYIQVIYFIIFEIFFQKVVFFRPFFFHFFHQFYTLEYFFLFKSGQTNAFWAVFYIFPKMWSVFLRLLNLFLRLLFVSNSFCSIYFTIYLWFGYHLFLFFHFLFCWVK